MTTNRSRHIRFLSAPRLARLRMAVCGLLAVALLASATPAAWAQRGVKGAADLVREAVQRLTVPRALLTDGPQVRAAFGEVVAGVRPSTVRVRADGKDVALGAIVGPDGWILTKASELKGDLLCKLPDGRELPARLVGVDPAHDLAMLRVEARDLPPVQWTSAESPEVGQWLATPGLKEDPLAIGVVSVPARKVPKLPGLLGVMLDEAPQGPKIIEVVPDSGAAEADIRVNDVVTHCNGKRTRTRPELVMAVRAHGPGEEIELTIRRDEKVLNLKATLGSHTDANRPNRRQVQNNMGGKLSARRDGFPTVLQHDTVLEPAECGGPIVNLDGEVVGINIARAGRTESYALPAATVRPLLDDLMSGRLHPDSKEKPAKRATSKSAPQKPPAVAEEEPEARPVEPRPRRRRGGKRRRPPPRPQEGAPPEPQRSR